MQSEEKTVRKINPKTRANPISAHLFLYMIPIFWKNFKYGLKEGDIYDVLEEHKSSRVAELLESEWQRQHTKNTRYDLHKALLHIYGFELTVCAILKFIDEIAKIVVLPLSVGKLVAYFEKGPPDITVNEAYAHAGILTVVQLFNAVVNQSVTLWMSHIGMKMRLSCSSLVYRKSLRLSRSSLELTTLGQIINLLSNDVRKFDEGMYLVHFAWIAPVQTVVGAYLLYQVLTVSAFPGISFLLPFILLQVYLGKLGSQIRRKTASRSDERVRLLSEILSGIQVIKMYNWKKPFAKLVSIARRNEMQAIRMKAIINGISFSTEIFATKTSIFISIMVYIWLGNIIRAETVFYTFSIYNILRVSLMKFAACLEGIATMHISILRLQTFLSYDEVKFSADEPYLRSEELKKALKAPKISLENVCARWNNSSQCTLTDINLDIKGPQSVAVIGPVGSGKSTLFNIILREIEPSNGHADIVGRVSYASQEPWLFSASIRQNIVFADKFDSDRYQHVIRACALESDFQVLPHGDRTLVGDKGNTLSGGQKARINLARCLYKHADIYLLDDPLSSVDTKVGKTLFANCIKQVLKDKICILITHQLQYLKGVDKIVILKEGSIYGEGKFGELQQSGLDLEKFLELSESHERANDNAGVPETSKQLEVNSDKDALLNKESIASSKIGFHIYSTYLQAGWGMYATLLLVSLIIVSHVLTRGGDYLLAYWMNLEEAANKQANYITDFNRTNIVYLYTGITIMTIITSIAYNILFFVFFIHISINIHNMIFEQISCATMQFFNDNPTGRILNRLSKDMGIIDEYIPSIFVDVVAILLIALGTLVIICIVNPWLLVLCLPLIGIFQCMRVVYLHTSRSVKRIEGITRSPIFIHAAASLNGLSTIRSMQAEKLLIKEFDNHQDVHSSAWYLFISSSRAFGFFLDISCIVFIAIITGALIIFNRGYYGGDVGLIITQLMYFSGFLQWGMRQYAELENHMTSVERILEYTTIETEPIRKPIDNLPKYWPEFGKIMFRNVSMKYKTSRNYVLKNLNFVINPKEKIGIVGRTGAGKTSLIAKLFQLYDIDGSIIIDDVDVTKIPLGILRSNISIIPQEPVLFSGTMRKNLDPFGEFNDERLWHGLEQVELKEVVEGTPGGLSAPVSENGLNFSVGQRQLVCLARAIIRNNKILVMDEATANIDPHTDLLIQKAIKTNFAECTIITVAHRLHTIIDSDRVMVLDYGDIVEFDDPNTLLQNTHGTFYSMIEATGNI